MEMTERQGQLVRQGLLVLLAQQVQRVVMDLLVQQVQQDPQQGLEHLLHLRGQSVYQQVVPIQQKYSHSQFPQGLLAPQDQQDLRVHRVVMVVMAQQGQLVPLAQLVRRAVMVVMEPQVVQDLLVLLVLKAQLVLLVQREQQDLLVRRVALVQRV